MKAQKHDSKIITGDFELKSLVKSDNLFPVVGIGASAGGLNAFKIFLKAIPENSGMAYVLVQHLDPKHESLLPELLQRVTRIPIIEISDDIKVHPNHIYVIPSNKIMVATDGVLLLAPRPEKSKTERHLPIDLFFTSLAEVHQNNAIGVVLSGTASDGTLGLKAIKDYGGITFAQDEESAEYDGMPNSAAHAGVVDFILPPGEIPKKLLEIFSKTLLSDEELQNVPKQDEDVFKQILSLLRIRKGVDFTYYKQTTIRRRILRRMVVNKNEETVDYLKFLRGNNQEQDLLFQDMLIPVTSFFRDKKTFDNLCNDVFPAILKNKIPGEITRIWVAGCSTGQEAYSFAICFKIFLGANFERIQIFGTDLSEPAIAKARSGMYEKSELDSVPPEILREYFTKNNGGYQINKSIRDMCVFAHHNFLKDPPFGKMDCISCRNVLIYMEPYLQKKALTTFHYALNPKGFLLLGKSETTGGVPDLFSAVEKNDKLYIRKDIPGRFMQVASLRSEQILNRPADSIKSEGLRIDFQKTADDILLMKYTPAGVVINEAMDIVHFRGNTSNFLEQAPGKPSHNLLMMAKNGLGFELRNILHKAKVENISIVKENIPLKVNGILRQISIEAVPLPNTVEPYYLILFHDNNPSDNDRSVISNRKNVSAKTKKEENNIQIQLLEQELAQAREDMRSITEDQEASNEELQSANEELLSGSEELQSLNEELETSQEELQSTNEELTVLNHELVNLNEQITDARNYAESIVATLYQPLLVLDKNLRVKTANKAFYKTFKVNEKETEGILVYDLGNRQWNIPELRTLLEEILPQKTQITDFEVTHKFSAIGERVILLSAFEITREKKEEKLILLSIEDITERKEAAKKIEESEKQKAFLLKLSDAMRSLSNSVDIEEAVTKIARDFMHADGCHYCTIEGDELIILRDSVREGLPSVVGTYQISNFALFKTILDAGRPIIIEDVRTTEIFDENLKQLCTQLQTISFINVPVIKKGKPVGLLSIVQSKPRKWTDTEVQLTIETAERTWAAVEKAIAGEALRQSEEKYRYLFNSINQGFALCELVRNKEGKAIDYRVLDVNSTYEKQTGLTMEMVLGKTILEAFPTLDKLWIETYAAVVDNQCPVVFERYFEYTNHWFAIKAYPNEKDNFAVLFDDITERKQVEERQAFVLKFSDALRTLRSAVAVQETAMNLLGEYMQVNRAFYSTALVDKETLVVGAGYHKNVIPLTGSYKFSDFDIDMMKIYGAGDTLIISDIEIDQRFSKKAKASFLAIEIVAAIGVPLVKDGMLIALVGVQQSISRKWTEAEIALIEEVSERTWDAVERATAEEKIVESETKFRTLIEDAPVATCLFTGKEMKIEVANDKMLAYWGKEKNIVGKTLANGVPELIGQPFFEILNDVFTTGIIYEGKNEIGKLEVNGVLNTYYFNYTYKAIRNAAGDVYGVMNMAVDVTEQVLARKKIEESEKRYNMMLLQSPFAFAVLKGKHMVIILANDSMKEMWGKGKDIEGKPLIEVLPEIKNQQFPELLDQVYTTGIPYTSYESLALLQRNGKMEDVYFNFVYQPYYEADETISGVVIIAVEITPQAILNQKIKESESRFRKMADLMPQKVWTSDIDGNYNYFNKCWLDYSGLDYEDLKDDGWKNVIHPEDWVETLARWQQSIVTGENFEMEHRLRNTKDIYKWHLSRGLLQKDENNISKIWIGTSTEMQHIKEEEQRKGNFIKMVSHELKTPVTSIKGYVQTLLMMLDDEEEKVPLIQLKSSLVRIDKQILNLTRLISEMLDLTRIEEGNLHLKMEIFDLNNLLTEIKDDILVSQPKYDIELNHDCSVSIFADRDRIGQVLINFINNGIKYSPKSNKIEIRIYKIDEDKVSVCVKDFGIGISKDDQLKIFERFYRVDGKNEETFSGFGIGLFIANTIIEKHQGTILINSEIDKGSEFIFTLNIA